MSSIGVLSKLIRDECADRVLFWKSFTPCLVMHEPIPNPLSHSMRTSGLRGLVHLLTRLLLPYLRFALPFFRALVSALLGLGHTSATLPRIGVNLYRLQLAPRISEHTAQYVAIPGLPIGEDTFRRHSSH